MHIAVERGAVYPAPGFRRTAYSAGLRRVNIRFGGGVFFGSGAVLFETQNPGRIVKVYCDSIKYSEQALVYDRIYFVTELLMAQRLSDLDVGPKFFGEVKVVDIPAAVFLSRDERFSFATPTSGPAYEMEYLDPKQGWKEGTYILDANNVKKLDRKIAAKIIVDILAKYTTLVGAGFVQRDLNFAMNIETGEARIFDAGSVRRSNENSVMLQREYILRRLRDLLDYVGQEIVVRQAVANFSGEMVDAECRLTGEIFLG